MSVDPIFLAPYPDEDGVTVAELGWRALPADATPAQRARAEAVWRAVDPDRPCRCSGPCWHGDACEEDGCSGRLIHVDRQAASMLSLIGWQDNYQCDTCGGTPAADIGVELPAIPWGEKVGAKAAECDTAGIPKDYGRERLKRTAQQAGIEGVSDAVWGMVVKHRKAT